MCLTIQVPLFTIVSFLGVRYTFNSSILFCYLSPWRLTRPQSSPIGGLAAWSCRKMRMTILDHKKPELPFFLSETGSHCVVLSGLELAV